MSFHVTAESYDRFMGRFSAPLADQFATWAGVRPGMRVLDVGSGPGALSSRLVEIVGADRVEAADPVPAFVEALRERLPGVTATVSPAEDLPHPDGGFDAALANLVVPFMRDAEAGLRQMARVVRDGGVVAASVWQHAEGTSPLTPFWDGVHRLDPEARDEGLVGVSEAQLGGHFAAAGLHPARAEALTVAVEFDSFQEWWEPFTFGVGPAGAWLAAQSPERREAVRNACADVLGPAPFTVTGSAWCVVAEA